MADNKQFQHVHEATSGWINSYSETGQAIADSLITLQVHSLNFAQSIFQTWMEVLAPQWWQPTQKQQDAFQRLMSTPIQPYLDFLLAPFAFSRKLVEASTTATQRERELVEARETVMHQERELAQKASR